MATAQTLEWLQLLAEAANRQRTVALQENAIAARAGQITQDGFKDFMRDVGKQLIEKPDPRRQTRT